MVSLKASVAVDRSRRNLLEIFRLTMVLEVGGTAAVFIEGYLTTVVVKCGAQPVYFPASRCIRYRQIDYYDICEPRVLISVLQYSQAQNHGFQHQGQSSILRCLLSRKAKENKCMVGQLHNFYIFGPREKNI